MPDPHVLPKMNRGARRPGRRRALETTATLLAMALWLVACRPTPDAGDLPLPTEPATASAPAVTAETTAATPSEEAPPPTAESLAADPSFTPLVDADLPGILLATGPHNRPDPVDPVITAQVFSKVGDSGAEVDLYLFYATGSPIADLELVAELPPGSSGVEIRRSPAGAVAELAGSRVTWRLEGLNPVTALGPFSVSATSLPGPVSTSLRWRGSEGEGSASARSGTPRTVAAAEGRVVAGAELPEAPEGPAALAFEAGGVGRALAIRRAPDTSPAAWQTAVAAEAPTAAPTETPAVPAAPDTLGETRWLAAWEVEEAGGGDSEAAGQAGMDDTPEVWLYLPLPGPALPGTAVRVMSRPPGAVAWFDAAAHGSVSEDGRHVLFPVGGPGTYAIGLPASIADEGVHAANMARNVFLTQIMRHAGTEGVAQAVAGLGDLTLLRSSELPFFAHSLGPAWVRLWLTLDSDSGPLHYVCGAGGCLVSAAGPPAQRLACPLMDYACLELPAQGALACNPLGYDRMICHPDPASVGSAPELAAPEACQQPCLVSHDGRLTVDGAGHPIGAVAKRGPGEAAAPVARGLILLGGRPLWVTVSATQDMIYHAP